jgi:hypothetical protein
MLIWDANEVLDRNDYVLINAYGGNSKKFILRLEKIL